MRPWENLCAWESSYPSPTHLLFAWQTCPFRTLQYHLFAAHWFIRGLCSRGGNRQEVQYFGECLQATDKVALAENKVRKHGAEICEVLICVLGSVLRVKTAPQERHRLMRVLPLLRSGWPCFCLEHNPVVVCQNNDWARRTSYKIEIFVYFPLF